MRFTPKTAKEIAEMRILPDGEYPFQITSAVDKVSSKGNDMIEVWMRVFKPDGNFIQVVDYLMESMAYKLRHACEATGLIDRYESGQLQPDELVEKTGMLKLTTQKGTGGYSDKNVVKDYIVSGEAVKLPVNKNDLIANLTTDPNDEIPF